MGYILLTGATGLLGTYLVRDLTRAGAQLAVLVRRTRFLSAQHRVEALVAHWEKRSDCALPRPVVLEGDLRDDSLGLDDAARAWVAENCTALMHNAASLTFHAEEPDGEPWRSNLHGTRHVLEFCRRAGIRQFHHVSTAYVCGLRQDTVFENDLDAGQQHGNDYEISKFQSETLVRQADFLDDLTIYRPAIIIGDSQTGYTTTYHGFYVPLKLVASLINKTAAVGVPRHMIEAGVRLVGQRLRDMLDLTGNEAKNYVPVDWVSAVMTHICMRPELHGKTYHLTPKERVSVEMMRTVIEDMVCRYVETNSTVSRNTYDWGEFEKFFIEGMNVYRSYWRDDPVFDYANTAAAAPHLPCPDIDADRIGLMCKYAIESNFGWPRPPLEKPSFDVHERLGGVLNGALKNGTGSEPTEIDPVKDPLGEGPVPLFQHAVGGAGDDAHAEAGGLVRLGLQVNGSGGGQWELTLKDGEIVRIRPGLSRKCVATYYLNSDTFRALWTRESSVEKALRAGRLLIEGNTLPPAELSRVLDRLVGRAGA
jgi:nucleoside-diphosphate-sugar epimerase